jgi:hypothetical protein
MCFADILQNSLPRLQITFPDNVGGSAQQQMQSLTGLQASTIKPPDFPLRLTLLLTSDTTIGALEATLLACRIDVEAFCFLAVILESR